MTLNLESKFAWLWISLCGVALMAVPAASADQGRDDHGHPGKDKTLYVWASDQVRVAPDFLAVIDFDEDSDDYGKVIRTSRTTVTSRPTRMCWPVGDCSAC
jgi:hypothetical protein